MAKRDASRKGWVIVTNNYDAAEEARFANNLFEWSIFGREVAPTTGTPHLQGYVHMKTKVRHPAMVKLFPKSKVIAADGNCTSQRAYCTKDGAFTEYGIQPKDGLETIKASWEEVLVAAKAGDFEAIPAETTIKYYSTIKKIRDDTQNKIVPAKLDWKKGSPPNVWIWGEAGVGKSVKARNMAGMHTP
ncbi:replication-associated protein [Crucivirus-175]|nr:replication-associated protein [Crucivirus-175]